MRWAIEQVNAAGAGPHSISFDASLAGSTITILSSSTGELQLSNSDVTISGLSTGGVDQNITLQWDPSLTWGSALIILDGADRNTIKSLSFKNTSQVIGALAIASDDNEIIDCTFVNGGGLYIGYIDYVPGGGGINKANNNTVTYTTGTGVLDGTLYIIGDENEVSNININGDLYLGAIDNNGNVVANSNQNLIHEFTVRDKTRMIGDENVLTNMTSGDAGTAKGQGVFVEGNDNQIITSTIHVGENLDGGTAPPPAGIVVKPGSNNVLVDQVVLTNALPVSQAIPVDGIRLEGVTGAVITDVESSDFWNGMIVRDNATGASISDSKFHNNENHGLFIFNGADNTVVTNIEAYENAFSGVVVWSSENSVITGSKAYSNTYNGFAYVNTTTLNTLDQNFAYGNVQGDGVLLEGGNGVVITNNTIGKDASGTVVGNGANGVLLQVNSGGNTIQGNTIVANGNMGVNLDASNQNRIIGNSIGNYDASNAALENGTNGINIANGASLNYIGGTITSQGNVIKNKTTGVAIAVDGATSRQNTIRGNFTSINSGKGIALLNSGNSNYGTITNQEVSFNTAESRTNMISGRAPAIGDTIDIYASVDGTCQAAVVGVPQGAEWKAFVIATASTNGFGAASWEFDISTVLGLTYDNAVVTATQTSGAQAGNTSEFASCIEDLLCTPPTKAEITVDPLTDFCENETVELTANVELGYTYQWYKDAVEFETAGVNKLVVTATESGKYTVKIYDPIDDVTCALTSAEVELTKHNNPVITGTIDGATPVCEGTSLEMYTLNDPNVADYTTFNWSLTNGATQTADGNGSEIIGVSFASVTDLDSDVNITVSVEVDHNGAICSSGDFTSSVSIERTPTVAFDNATMDVQCNSLGNEFTITDYDASSVYTVQSSPAGATVDLTNLPIVSVDVDVTSGVITLKRVTANGCEGTGNFSVAVKGCGRNVDFHELNDQLVFCAGDTMTLVSDSEAGNGESILNYEWKFTDAANVIPLDAQGGVDADQIRLIVTNTTTTPILLSVELDVVFTGNVLETETKLDYITINPPASTISLTEVNGAKCEGEQALYEVTPLNLNSTYNWTGPNGFLENDPSLGKGIHTLGADDYTVTVVEVNQYGCSSAKATLQETVNPLPKIGAMSGVRRVCDFDDTNDEYTFSIDTDGADIFDWSVTRPLENIAGSNGTSTFTVKFSGHKQLDTVFVDAGSSQCGALTTSKFAVYLDTTFHVNHKIVQDDIFCEGDTGSFYVLPEVVGDVNNEFGTEDWHYSIFDWGQETDSYPLAFNSTKTVNVKYDSTAFGGTVEYYTILSTNGVAVDFLKQNGLVIDSTNSGTYGPFALEDSVYFLARPEFCFHKDSQVFDSLEIEIQEKPEIRMTIEGDEDVHVISDVVSIPQIEINDINNLNGNLDYQYAISWIDKDGNPTIDGVESFAPAVFGKTVATPPSGYDQVKYVMALETGACLAHDTTLLLIDFGIFVPTVFTPNGDGQYDEWVIQNIEKFSGATVQVYNLSLIHI